MRTLYMDDSYLKEFTSTALVADGSRIILENTAFFPLGGGVLNDEGTLNGQRVVMVEKTLQGIVHVLESGTLNVGDTVQGVIDWQRRYRLMRMHTAAHLLSALFHDIGAKITGNSIELEKSKIDFGLDDFNRDLFDEKVTQANALITQGAQVSIRYLPRDEALSQPHLVKLAGALPPNVDELRIVTIQGIDEQADGGCHVRNITEIGSLSIIKLENKGAGRKRLYFTL